MNGEPVQLSAVAPAQYRALMQVLVSFCLVILEDSEDWLIPAYLWERIKKNTTASRSWMKDTGLLAAYDDAVGSLSKGSTLDTEELWEFMASFKEVFPTIRKDNTLSSQQVELLNSVLIFINRQSDPSLTRLAKSVSLLGDPDLTSLVDAFFSESGANAAQHIDVGGVKKTLQKLVRKYSAERSLYFPERIRSEVRQKQPTDYKLYLELHRQLRTSYTMRLRSLVRDSRQKLISTELVREVMRDEGLICGLPDGFVGMVDDAGRIYTTEGRKLKALPQSAVRMNPQYDPKTDNTYVFTARAPGAAQDQRYYTEDFAAQSAAQKFAKTDDFIAQLKLMAPRWRRELNSGDQLTKLLATITEIAYLTSARIGSKTTSNAAGITTWRARHFRKIGSYYRVQYTGKSGMLQKHYVRPETAHSKLVIKTLDSLLNDLDPDDFVWVDRTTSGRSKRVTSTDVNAYLKRMGATGATAKSFRTARGTMLFSSLMDKSKIFAQNEKKPVSAREAIDEFNSMLQSVGAQLGHFTVSVDGGAKITGATAMNAYIDPSIMATFFDRLGHRYPPTLEKLLRNPKSGGTL